MSQPTGIHADTEYLKAQRRVDANLDRIHQALNQHIVKQSAFPKDWGFVGDLNRVNELLDLVLPAGATR